MFRGGCVSIGPQGIFTVAVHWRGLPLEAGGVLLADSLKSSPAINGTDVLAQSGNSTEQ